MSDEQRPPRWWHRWLPAKSRLEPLCIDGTRRHRWAQDMQVSPDAYVTLCLDCNLGWGANYRGLDALGGAS